MVDSMSFWFVARLGIIGLLPLLIVSVCIFAWKNVFVGMFIMHWVAMAIPVIVYAFATEGKDGIRWYMTYLRKQSFMSSVLLCFLLFLGGVALTVAGYILMSCRFATWEACIGQVNENVAEYGFHDAPIALVIACAVYFPVVNPFIEEMFWRVFMLRELSKDMKSDLGDIQAEQNHLLEPAGEDVALGDEIEAWIVSWPKRIFGSALYASYHTLVVGLFLGGFLYGILSFFFLTILGVGLVQIFLLSPPNRGFYRAVFLHAGIDTGVVIALGDAIGWYRLV